MRTSELQVLARVSNSLAVGREGVASLMAPGESSDDDDMPALLEGLYKMIQQSDVGAAAGA